MGVAWITGARGFIGCYLARALSADGMIVAGVGHGAWPPDEAARCGVMHWINGEIAPANMDSLAALGGAPEVVFHLAGGSAVGMSLRTPEEDFRRSVDSTVQVLEWVRNHAPDVRVVLSSSAAVYGAAHDRPITEDARLAPYSPYGYHKRIAELLCESYSRNFGIATAIVRLFSVYGPGLRKQLLWDLCGRLKQGVSALVLAGSGAESRDWLHASDAAAFLSLAARHADDSAMIVNGATGRAASVREIAQHVVEAWGGEVPITFSGESRPGDPEYLVSNPALGRTVGFTSRVHWEDGISEYVQWYRDTELAVRK